MGIVDGRQAKDESDKCPQAFVYLSVAAPTPVALLFAFEPRAATYSSSKLSSKLRSAVPPPIFFALRRVQSARAT